MRRALCSTTCGVIPSCRNAFAASSPSSRRRPRHRPHSVRPPRPARGSRPDRWECGRRSTDRGRGRAPAARTDTSGGEDECVVVQYLPRRRRDDASIRVDRSARTPTRRSTAPSPSKSLPDKASSRTSQEPTYDDSANRSYAGTSSSPKTITVQVSASSRARSASTNRCPTMPCPMTIAVRTLMPHLPSGPVVSCLRRVRSGDRWSAASRRSPPPRNCNRRTPSSHGSPSRAPRPTAHRPATRP